MKIWIFTVLIFTWVIGLSACSSNMNSTDVSSSVKASTNEQKTASKTLAPEVNKATTTAAASDESINDKLLSFWKSLPSTQWFVDDGKPAEVG